MVLCNREVLEMDVPTQLPAVRPFLPGPYVRQVVDTVINLYRESIYRHLKRRVLVKLKRICGVEELHVRNATTFSS